MIFDHMGNIPYNTGINSSFDIVGFALDLDTKKMRIFINGEILPHEINLIADIQDESTQLMMGFYVGEHDMAVVNLNHPHFLPSLYTFHKALPILGF